jgi:hypothetical protein
MAEEKKPAASEDKGPTPAEKFDALCDAVAGLVGRMDAFEAKSKADAAEDEPKKEEEKKADASEDKKEEKAEEKEEKKEEKADAKKDEGDGDAGGDDKGKPEPLADAKKDAEMADAKKDAKADARADALQRRIDELDRRTTPRARTDEEIDRIAEEQQAWDAVAQMHGERISRPTDGETIDTYARRCAKKFQKHSAKWEKIDLSALPSQVLAIATPEIRADAIKAAYHSDPATPGLLREIRRADRTGRMISEFVGPVAATLAPFRLPVMRVRRIVTNPNQQYG